MEPRSHDLALRARSGDRRAFDELTTPLRARLENQIRARMSRAVSVETDASDIAQESLLKAWGAMERFEWRGEEAFFRWLASIAEHLIWSASQKAGRQRIGLRETEVPEPMTPALERASREERAQRLERALAGLTPAHREVIVLTRLERLSIADVASRMDRTPNAVRKLLGRALEELRQRFGDTTGSLRLPDRPLEIGGASDDE